MNSQVIWLILGLPLLAFALIAFGVRRNPKLSAAVGILAIAGAFALSIFALLQVMAGGRLNATFVWAPLPPTSSAMVGASAPALAIVLPFQIDPLTSIMLVVVTSVALLVLIYSLGYMDGDPGFSRYYAALVLFTFSMLGLVLAGSLISAFIFWELVGLCSFLLIGHWNGRAAEPGHLSPAAAANKAFLVTRLGDVGFLIGIVYLYAQTGTFEFARLAELASTNALVDPVLAIGVLLLFCGAVGKSAQFPLHVWLPDAMEGPTPVSALIHAATMVAAGVYLMARTFPLLEHSPTALAVVATIGGFTALFAASMGLVATDIKRVLAYSTVSQLGYMMLAIGVGAMAAGMFHLFNHAFFKALLFLGAGSVIHLAGTNEIFKMGGLRRWRPVTFLCMLVAALSLAGIPPLSGFWSKDEILVAAASTQPVLFGLALVTSLMTAFYMFRVIFVTFLGTHNGDLENRHTHGEPRTMMLPLVVLVIPSIVSGLAGSPFLGNPFASFLEGHAAHSEFNPAIAALSTAMALGGIALAWAMYGRGSHQAGARLSDQLHPIHELLINKYYVDHFYTWIVARIVFGVARLAQFVDTHVIDGAVNGLGATAVGLGATLRRLQTGQVQTYAWVLFAGIVALTALVFLPVLFGGRS